MGGGGGQNCFQLASLVLKGTGENVARGHRFSGPSQGGAGVSGELLGVARLRNGVALISFQF